MSDTKETADKTLRAGARKPLTLPKRTVEAGHVQQKFSHGRSKSVEVVKKKKRLLPGQDGEAAVAPEVVEKPQPRVAAQPARPAGEPVRDEAAGATARTLSEQERDARARALAAAHVRDAEVERQRAIDAERAAEEQRRAAAEAAAAKVAAEAAAAAATSTTSAPAPATDTAPPAAGAVAAPVVAASAATPSVPTPPVQRPTMISPPVARPTEQRPSTAGRLRASDTAPRRDGPRPGGPTASASSPRPSGQEPPRRFAGMIPQIVARTDRPSPKPPTPEAKPEVEQPRRSPRVAQIVERDEDEGAGKKKGIGAGKVVRTPVKSNDDSRVRGKLTITNALDENQRGRSLAALKRKREREKLKAMGIQQPREKIVREVIIPEMITIQELSNRMTERAVDLIKLLMKQGAMHQINDVIDADTAELIVTEFGHTPKRVSEADVEEGFIGAKDVDEHLMARAPVVTIMGHVDHGKTSLLDAIRKANVAAGEAGGITQHIGAYQVASPSGGMITFIDTPGHEAFTEMRARGAKVTDIVILVVAADDGVMPQTIEAINHAKAANVPIIVAINKIDKPDSDPNRVRTELLQHEIVVESMSGETLDVPVSAIKGTNLDKLLEAITLQSELLDLKSNPDRSAEGFVIEAKLERGRGPVGTLLVQRGTLKVGDIVVAGSTWGRVRALLDDRSDPVKEAGPSVPVEVLGFDSAPEAGDQFAVVENEARAREITDYRIRKRRDALGNVSTGRTLEAMMQQLKETGKKEFILVVKGDVQGSIEAIAGALKKISTDEVEARIVHSGVGGITESDIALADASKAVILGFNVRANAQAKAHADRDGIEIRYYNIIYDLVDDVKSAMSGMLAPTKKETFLGYATIKQVFNITKVGKVAGCQVSEGRVERGAKVRLLRDKVVIHEGTLSILKRFKDDVREVQVGQECGMSFANYQDIREGDEIECFTVEMIQRTL
jgi:translation initiation factor IF-2